MKNKKLLLLTSVLAVTTLVGCDAGAIDEGTIEKVDNIEVSYPDEMLLNHRVVSVFTGENYVLSPIAQFNYNGENLTYTSQDNSIATVDEKGNVKGIKSGETGIIVSDKNNPSFNTVVPVIVTDEMTNNDDIDKVAADLSAINEDNLNEFVDFEMYEKRVYKEKVAANGDKVLVLQSYDRYDQRMTISIDDAYFRIWETDAEIKTENGAIDFTNYEWIFYTNAFFDTYTFHQTGDVKNYFRASTQSYMEGKRIDPLYDILDNIFVSGSEVMTNSLDGAKISKFADMLTADYSNVTNQRTGSNGAGQAVFSCDVTFSDETADQDTETRYGIPFGTPIPAVQRSRYTVKDDRLVAASFQIEETYSIGDDNYVEIYDIDHQYFKISEDRSEIFIPNRKEYTEVDMLFSV